MTVRSVSKYAIWSGEKLILISRESRESIVSGNAWLILKFLSSLNNKLPITTGRPDLLYNLIDLESES